MTAIKNTGDYTFQAKRTFLEKIVGWGVLLMVVALPILFINSWTASSITSKVIVFMGVSDVLVAIWVWLMIVDHRYRLSKKNLLGFLPAFLLLASLTISSLFGVDIKYSFFSTIESGTGMLFLYHAFLFSGMVASLVRVRGKVFFKSLIQANLIPSLVLAIATCFTNFAFNINSQMLNLSNGGAMMGNVLFVAAYFVFSIFLTLVLIGMESDTAKKNVYMGALALLVLSPTLFLDPSIWQGVASIGDIAKHPLLIIGHARMATASIGLGVVLSFFIWVLLSAKTKTRRVLGGVGVGAIFLFLAVAIVLISIPHTKIQNSFLKESENRTLFWGEAIHGIKTRPILGWGQENFHVAHQQFIDPQTFTYGRGDEVWVFHPHNVSLEILLDGGIVGFILYVVMFAMLIGGLIQLYRKDRISSGMLALFLGMLFAYVLQNQMMFDSTVTWTFLFITIGLVAAWSDENREEKNLSAISAKGYTLGILVTVVALGASVYTCILPARKISEMHKVGQDTAIVQIAEYDHLFNSSGSYFIDTDPEAFTEWLVRMSTDNEQVIKTNPALTSGFVRNIQKMIDATSPLVISHPTDYRLELSLSELENLEIYLTGDLSDSRLTQARFYEAQAMKLSPGDPQIYTVASDTELYAGNLKGARDYAEKAISINPQFLSAWTFAINLEKFAGNQSTVQAMENRALKYFSKVQLGIY